MWFLLIFLEIFGSTSCIIKIKHSQNFVSSKHWWRNIQGSMWKILRVTMVVITSPMNSRNFVEKKEFKGSWLRLITHNRMGLQKERKEQLWVRHEWCCMIRAYRFIYWKILATQRYLWKTVVLIRYLAWVHQRRIFLVRNLMFHILKILAHLSISLWPKIPGRS